MMIADRSQQHQQARTRSLEISHFWWLDGGPGVLARAAPPLLPILSHGGPTVLLIIKGMLREAII